MLVEDTTGFVETLDVVSTKKQTDKLKRRATNAELELLRTVSEVRLFEEGLACMKRAQQGGASAREVEAAQARLTKLRGHAAVLRTRFETLDANLRSSLAVSTTRRTYRLHSSRHHVDCSPSQFEHLSDVQRAMPVWITTTDGQRWWWFLDRFWWDDVGLTAEQVRNGVLEGDRERHEREEARERAHAEVVGGSSRGREGLPLTAALRSEVWQRDLGRCVDCGAVEHLVFDPILPIDDAATTAANLELRCEGCVVRRRQNQARATVSRARVDALPAHELLS